MTTNAVADLAPSTSTLRQLPPFSPKSARPLAWLREIIQRRDLLYMLTLREVKIKYKQSVMGLMWAILMPALIVIAGVLVKFAFASVSGRAIQSHDIVSVGSRSIPWAFFVASVRFASVSLIANSNLVGKIYMPRMIFPIASVLSQLIDLLVATSVLAIVLVVTRTHVGLSILWLPVLFGVMVVLVTGLAISLSAAALFFRDVKYIVEVIMTFAIFFTPVFYEVSMFGDWAHLLLLNPVAPLLEGISAAVLGRPQHFGWLLYSAGLSLIVLLASVLFFRRTEPYFAECA